MTSSQRFCIGRNYIKVGVPVLSVPRWEAGLSLLSPVGRCICSDRWIWTVTFRLMGVPPDACMGGSVLALFVG